MVQFHQPLKLLHDAGVEFVVIGGIAAVLHGSGMATFDVDVCTPMTDENVAKIVAALRSVHPRHRMHPDKPPLPEDPARLKGFRNLCLTTDVGVIDLLGELPGVGSFAEIKDKTVEYEVGGFNIRILDLETLIASKTAAGREKDKLGVDHLRAIQKRNQEEPGLFDRR